MNINVAIIALICAGCFSFINFLFLLLMKDKLKNMDESIINSRRDINDIKSCVKETRQSVTKKLEDHHDKLNLIKDRQWFICEYWNIKNSITDWEKNKI